MLVSQEEYEKRLSICRQCPHMQNAKVPICSLCGCMLKMKARLDGFDCPLGKWSGNENVMMMPLIPIPGCNSCGKKV